jgi:purine-binding chemotaxis protein CheW
VTAQTEAERRQHVNAVLAERARLLAQSAVETSVVPTLALVQFGAGNERYAIAAEYVRRLERLGSVTPLPDAPRHFAGITNIHGQLIPLVDLRVLLGAEASANATFGVVLGEGRAEIGIIADTLLEMRTIALDALEPAGSTPSLVRHILPDGAAVIDGAALIADPRLTIGDAVSGTQEENAR